MIAESAEIRWIFAGPPPPAADAFGYETWGAAEVRTDIYLLFGVGAAVGVKLRDRNFEVKALTRVGAPTRLAPAITGVSERWVKWSIGDPSVQAFGAAMQAGAPTAAVAKRRWLKRYSTESGAPVVAAPGARLASGCGVEITALTLDGRPWWSFGLEAFGPAAELETILETVAAAFLADHPYRGPTLTEAESLSYPSWLAGART